jgi:hypothetical protein
MAKRPTTKPQATESDAPAQPKAKRTRTPAAAATDQATDRPTEQAPMGPPAEPSDEDIRRRAYDRYLARGGNHGLHFDDWLEAERELKTKK